MPQVFEVDVFLGFAEKGQFGLLVETLYQKIVKLLVHGEHGGFSHTLLGCDQRRELRLDLLETLAQVSRRLLDRHA